MTGHIRAPHLSIYRTFAGDKGLSYELHITKLAYESLGRPQYVKFQVKIKTQKIRIQRVDGPGYGVHAVNIRGKSFRIGRVNRLVDAGMLPGNYMMTADNIFVRS